jgi:hypothetical protein
MLKPEQLLLAVVLAEIQPSAVLAELVRVQPYQELLALAVLVALVAVFMLAVWLVILRELLLQIHILKHL